MADTQKASGWRPPGAILGSWQALGSVQQWLLGDCRIILPSTHSLRPSPLWYPQGLRGHLLQPEAGRGVGGQDSRLHCVVEAVGRPSQGLSVRISSMEWANHTTRLLAQRTHECWLLSRQGPAPASLALTPASACMPPGLESSLPSCQHQGWPKPQALTERVRSPWVGGRTERGSRQVKQLWDGNGEDGEREEGAHLCPPPPLQPA